MHYKEKFVRFLLETGALKFGDHTLKNGLKSPYMIDTNKFDSGASLSRLGCFYARAIYEKMEFDVIPWETTMVFGSANKGISLAAATAIALAAAFDIDLAWSFNRKGAGGQGSEGVFEGRKPGPDDHILIIGDVMHAGTSLRDTVEMLSEQAPEAKVIGSIMAVDRKERGRDKRLTAVAEAHFELGIPIFPIIDIDEILGILKSGEIEREFNNNVKAALPTAEQIAAVENYLAEHRAS